MPNWAPTYFSERRCQDRKLPPFTIVACIFDKRACTTTKYWLNSPESPGFATASAAHSMSMTQLKVSDLTVC